MILESTICGTVHVLLMGETKKRNQENENNRNRPSKHCPHQIKR